jgi:hypothetical protein
MLDRLLRTLALGALVALVVPATASAQYSYYRDDHVRHRPAHIGLSGIGGAEVHTQHGVVDGFASLGLDVLGTLVPGFALGFTRAGVQFGYADLEGPLFGVEATPTIELSFFPSSDAQLFLQIGATVAFSTATKLRPMGFDAAVTSAIGARFWLGNTFTFGILIGSQIGATNPGVRQWFAGPLGIAELSFFAGLELGWNL